MTKLRTTELVVKFAQARHVAIILTIYPDSFCDSLRSSQSVSYDTPDHAWWQAYAGFMMIVYPIGTPLLYGWVLWKYRRLLQSEQEREKEENTVGRGAMRFDEAPLIFSLLSPLSHRSTYFRAVPCGINTSLISTVSTSLTALDVCCK